MPDFTSEEIEEAIKSSQKFKGANLVGIDLSKANLFRAILRDADLSGAKYNKSTKFPDVFDPEEAGMVLVQ